ncbi:MAG: 2Fe-2S iron-sulfur cluster binding domain-containing protein [Deltaproteobacteria bacterium]|nr:2Fe-2S iron-sulfur cluster binding domain-containing protein [Deltaproteobacteria bacterium]
MARITFLKNRLQPEDATIDVAEGTTLLKAAQDNAIPLGHACGGVCACSTCHVYVRRGFDSLGEMEEDESDILDKAFGVLAVSRLGCQTKVARTDLVVEITPESSQAYENEHPELKPK